MRKQEFCKEIDIESYLFGYLEYIKACGSMPFFRYEDFVQNPQFTMQLICQALSLNYDEHF
jgi:hypothetical protein